MLNLKPEYDLFVSLDAGGSAVVHTELGLALIWH